MDESGRRAKAAIERIVIEPGSPFACAEARIRRAHGFPAPEPEALLAFWESRQPGSRAGDDRYRWEISHKRCTPGPHVPAEPEWRPFRPDVPTDRIELSLSLPISITEQASFLEALVDELDADGSGTATGTGTGRIARRLLVEAEPLMRRDLAASIAALSPWADTFTLCCLVKHDRALDRFGPIALAIASSYAFLAGDGGVITGLRAPFYDKPLVSATAQLAAGLVKLGVALNQLGALVRHVRAVQAPGGGWGDPHGLDAKFGREDLLTTYVCADLLARVDPTFQPEHALAWMASRQDPSGFFMAYGPELVWLTGEILDLAREAERPFAERFSFPHVAPLNVDRKTGLPFYAYFDDLARLYAELPGVADAPTELAFIDLAGFRAFNTKHGQDMGDLVLAAFAESVDGVGGARAVRDGGDEFLIVGSPTRRGLPVDLDAMRRQWPAEFRRRFPGAEVVAPRILVAGCRCGEIRACREMLGRRVGDLKARALSVAAEGVLERVDSS